MIPMLMKIALNGQWGLINRSGPSRQDNQLYFMIVKFVWVAGLLLSKMLLDKEYLIQFLG